MLFRKVEIDGRKINTANNMRYRGAGMVSANNSSRLMMDYKWEHPESYRKILELIFGRDGLAVSHLKIEMGSDINSSSGTEPSVKRKADEKADVRRGAGFMLARDAKEINPDLTLDMLWWSEPRWVSDSDDVYAMRYAWYKESLDEAYYVYGLVFDYVSAVRNERAIDGEWIKYLSKRLKSEKNCPYDYSKIKIVAGDEVCTWVIADMMCGDRELLDAVDVIGSHYTSRSSDNAKKLAKEYGKELWFSEASTPMQYVAGAVRFDKRYSGLGGLNGVLDVANRFITMYAEGCMTLCEYQPIVAAYYDGVNYSHKQYIEAADPWSGYFRLDEGFFMQLHFSRFIKKGWCFVDGANFGDGKVGGDGHALVDASYSYLTAADPVTGDYTVVITNTTSEPIKYSFKVCGQLKTRAELSIWETKGPDGGAYDENYFKKKGIIRPDGGFFEYVIAPDAIVTISTLDTSDKVCFCRQNKDKKVLSLPYYDDFSYADYPVDYLSSRGMAPRYMTDQGGAFEVVKGTSGNMLMQKILPETKADEWGGTPEPTTNFGDDRWFNYSLSADITLAGEGCREKEKNYAGIGIRYFLAADDRSGYSFLIFSDGKWILEKNGTGYAEGKYCDFNAGRKVRLKLTAIYAGVRAYIEGTVVFESSSDAFSGNAFPGAGRAALYSAYAENCFENLAVEPVEETDAFAVRLDDTDDGIDYTGDWKHELMSSFRNYKRTLSTGTAGSSFSVRFTGSGIALAGENAQDGEACVIGVEIDGKACETAYEVPVSGRRELFYARYGLDEAKHVLKVTVLKGRLNLDYVLI